MIDTPGLRGNKRRWYCTVHFLDGREPKHFYVGTMSDIDQWHLRSTDWDEIAYIAVERIQSSVYNAEHLKDSMKDHYG